MQITSNISNRYPNLQVMTGVKTKNVNQTVSAEAIINTEKKNFAAQTSSVIPTGYSYFPEIIDDSQSEPAIEKVSFVNGICSDVEKAAEYEREVYGQRNEIDYSGMSGGEIITSIIDRYSQYFECDDLLNLQETVNMYAPNDSGKTDYVMANKLYLRIFDEINSGFEKYGINSEEAFSEFYGYEKMTIEEKSNVIVSKHANNGLSFYEYNLMLDELSRTGCISKYECGDAVSAISIYEIRTTTISKNGIGFSADTLINLDDVYNNHKSFLDDCMLNIGNNTDNTVKSTIKYLNITEKLIHMFDEVNIKNE